METAMNASQLAALEDSEYYRLEAAAKALNVSLSTVRRWVYNGDLPAARIGRRLLVAKGQDIKRMFRVVGDAD